MSENPDGLEQWRKMLESMLGPEAAQEAMRAISASGMDLSGLPENIDPGQLQAAMAQMQQLLSASNDGESHWRFAGEVARQVAHTGGDPVVTAAAAEKVRSVVSVANLWLDTAITFDPIPGPGKAATRVEWAQSALPALRQMAEPVGSSVADALTATLADQAQHMPAFGPVDIGAMMGNLGRLGFAMQVGQAAGTLAREVFGGTDIGVPLHEGGPMLVPSNITAFVEGLDTPEDELWHFLAVREVAHARLFNHVPWLRAHLLGAVEQYARGIEIDLDQLESSVREIDPTNMDQLRTALSGDIFLGAPNESQQRALARLETMLALVEGWVEEVTAAAVAPHLPNAVALREMLRRRRAAGGPAEDTFRILVGLELRPRRVREAAALWSELTRREGTTTRDELWQQLDLMPTSADLDDPVGFVERLHTGSGEFTDLEAELAKILGEEPAGDDPAGEEPTGNGPSGQEPADNGPSDQEPADNGPSDQEPAGNGSADDESAGNGPAGGDGEEPGSEDA